jgi:hypothetical protein
MMKELRLNSPKSSSEILTSSFWWNKIIHTWDVGFSKSKAVEFHGLGWVSMSNVWVASARRFASKEEMGENFVLFPKEELGYERIITKLEESKRCGGVYSKRETFVAKKEIKLVCWKRTRHSRLWFVVLHLPLDLNATTMFNTSTSCKTLNNILWAPNQGP